MTGPAVRATTLALELTAALEGRRNAGVLWTRVTSTSAHYLCADGRFDITVRARKAASGAWCWLWEAYHDGRFVTPRGHQHANPRGAMIRAELFMTDYQENTVAGPYCTHCDHRCFVYRELPDHSWSGQMATCAAGAARDLRKLGFDHTTAINPTTLAHLMRLLYDLTALDQAATRRVLATVLRGLAAHPIAPERFETHARYLEEASRHADSAT